MAGAPKVGPRAYLKANGFLFETKPQRIDAALLKALDAASRNKIEEIWALKNMGISNGLEAYEVPQTGRQAALLFSHDWPRAVATMIWFSEAIAQLAPASMVEMGCGAGFLLGYLQVAHPAMRTQGIDAATNLAAIASQVTGRPVIAGDYRSVPPDGAYDLVLCDFGFDLARFSLSTREHVITSVGGQEFCLNCSDDMAAQFAPYVRAWRSWGTPSASLALAGRIGGFGQLRALMLAAKSVGWELSIVRSKVLAVQSLSGQMERFPALVFSPSESSNLDPNLEAAAQLFSH